MVRPCDPSFSAPSAIRSTPPGAGSQDAGSLPTGSPWPPLLSAWGPRSRLRSAISRSRSCSSCSIRFGDGLDGAIARATAPTDRGGFLDISLDFIVYAAIPLAFAIYDPAQNALSAAILLASFLANGGAFLAFARLGRTGGASSRVGTDRNPSTIWPGSPKEPRPSSSSSRSASCPLSFRCSPSSSPRCARSPRSAASCLAGRRSPDRRPHPKTDAWSCARSLRKIWTGGPRPAITLRHDPPRSRFATRQSLPAAPAEAEAGGLLTIDLGRDRGQLEEALEHDRAGRMCGRCQGRRLWLRPRAGDRQAGEGRMPDFLRRRRRGGTARAGDRAREHHLRAQRADAGHGSIFRRCRVAAGHQQHDRACRVGRFRRHQELARRRGAAGRYRLQPARHHARRGDRDRAAHPIRTSRLHAADEPARLWRHARSSDERSANSDVPRDSHHVSRRAVLARPFVGNIPRRNGFLRSGAAGRRAVRDQSDPRTRNPMRPVVELKARIIQVRTIKRGETVGYGATLDGRPTEPHCDHRHRLCATASCDRPVPPSTRAQPRSSSAASVVPLAGRVSMDLFAVDVTDLPEAPCGAAISPP